MRIVAARALKLAFLNGHMGGFLALSFSLEVALIAGFGFGVLDEKGRAFGAVHAVTLDAGEIAGFMLAPFPEHPLAVVVALEADGRRFGPLQILGIFDGRKTRIGLVSRGFRMERARAVAGFAGFFKSDFFDGWKSPGVDVLFKGFALVAMAGDTSGSSHFVGSIGQSKLWE